MVTPSYAFLYRLSLGELRRAAGGLEAVLFTLLHSRVAGEKASPFKDGAHLVRGEQQRARKAVADGAGLAGYAAACDGADDIVFAERLGQGHRLADNQLEGVKAEIIVDVSAIDGDAAAAGINSDAGNGTLSAACAVEIRLTIIHNFPSPLLFVPGLRLLGFLAVVGVAVDAHAGERFSAERVVRQHALDRHHHGALGVILHQRAVLDLFEAADPAAVMTVELVFQLVAGQHRLGGVDDDNMVAAIDVGREDRLMLAAQKAGNGGGGAAQGLARCVDDIPLALDVICLRKKG